MRATEQYLPHDQTPFIMLYKVVLTFESVVIQTKATEQYSPKVLLLLSCGRLLSLLSVINRLCIITLPWSFFVDWTAGLPLFAHTWSSEQSVFANSWNEKQHLI